MATFYADSAGAQGTGDGSTEANAATLKQCFENDAVLYTALVADSTIWCKTGTGITFDGSAGVFLTTSVAGQAKWPIKVRAYTTTTGDGGVTTITDTDAGATNICMSLAHEYWHIEGFKFVNTKTAISTGTNNGIYVRNCEADNFATRGFETGAASGERSIWESCYAHDGVGEGFYIVCRDSLAINCVSSNNTTYGFYIGHASYGATVINCLAYKNGSAGFDITGTLEAINCLAYGNTSDGWYMRTANGANILINCGSAANGAYGITGISTATPMGINCSFNPTNETNTSGKSATLVLVEIDEVTGDPLFTDTTPAVEGDLSLGSSSAWKAAGAKLGGAGWTSTDTFVDIGVAQREEPAGGGAGGAIVNQGLHAIDSGIMA